MVSVPLAVSIWVVYSSLCTAFSPSQNYGWVTATAGRPVWRPPAHHHPQQLPHRGYYTVRGSPQYVNPHVKPVAPAAWQNHHWNPRYVPVRGYQASYGHLRSPRRPQAPQQYQVTSHQPNQPLNWPRRFYILPYPQPTPNYQVQGNTFSIPMSPSHSTTHSVVQYWTPKVRSPVRPATSLRVHPWNQHIQVNPAIPRRPSAPVYQTPRWTPAVPPAMNQHYYQLHQSANQNILRRPVYHPPYSVHPAPRSPPYVQPAYPSGTLYKAPFKTDLVARQPYFIPSSPPTVSQVYSSPSTVTSSEKPFSTWTEFDEENPREDPTTSSVPTEELVTPKSLMTRHIHYQHQQCEKNMKCRSVYNCMVNGGQPTSVNCAGSPTYYCCKVDGPDPQMANATSRVISDPHCGWSREPTSRIVGGSNAEFGQYPWQVFIQVGNARCGGALVSHYHVVTAAHCINGKLEEELDVLLGELILLSSVEELPHERRKVRYMEAHPCYRDLNIDSYDVAILVLDRPVDFQANISPVCLPNPGEEITGTLATVSGWGRIYADQGFKAYHLQAVQVPVIDNLLCRLWFRKRNKFAGIHQDHLCAGYEQGGRDSCRGDSGGPLVYQKNGRWHLIGLVSAGYGCSEPMQPGIYHRVSTSSEWISDVVFGRRTTSDNLNEVERYKCTSFG